MADRYLLESSPVDGYLMEDGLGVLLLEVVADETFFENRVDAISFGMKEQTASGLNGVLVE